MTLESIEIADPVPTSRYASPVRPALVGLGAATGFVLFFGLWSVLAPVSGAVIADGNLQVEAQRQSVQHPYGGVVSQLLVREGQKVKKGQTLIVLADNEPRAKLDVLLAEQDALLAQSSRLIAERDGQSEPAFPSALTSRDTAAARQAMANERAVMAARRREFEAESGILHSKVKQLEEQISGTTAQIKGLERQRALIEEEAAGARTLLAKGFTPKTRVLALERTEAQLDSERGAKLSERASAEQAIDEAKLAVAKQERSRMSGITDQLRTAQSKLAELGPKIDAARDVLTRTRIKAPMTGSVVGLTAFTEGGVIQPGARVLDVIPADDSLIANARLRLADVNEVKPGSDADIRLTGVPRNARPTLHGKVLTVSADKLTDDRSGQGYYALRVKLDAKDVQAAHVDLQPGMPLEAIITTHPRTLLQYVLGPFIDEVTGAFRER